MNEHDESENAAPPILSAPAPSSPEIPRPKPFSYWAKRFLICNPFYLVSAALLLFGMYRVSADGNLFAREIPQLAFNLSSLECYEILLVGTAVFLAARRIWYDSTLLVGLENLLIFVPFILLSQVALISTRAVWVVCAVTMLLAMTRFGFLKLHFTELHLPKGLLIIGAVLLVVNIALLAAYRIVCETKPGWAPVDGRYFVFNQLTWLAILPAALALANFLPHARETGSFEPQRRWLPAGFFLLWIAATGVHLYCLNYVYLFAFQFAMVVPALWALAWTAYRRAPEIFAWGGRAPQYAMAASALLVPLAAISESGTKIFFVLALLNAAIFAAMCLRERNRQFACHLLFASVVLAVCGMPAEWIALLTPGLHREIYVGVGLAVYLMLYTVASRNPKAGIFGALLVGAAVLMTFSRHDAAIHWAVQSALVFLLLHSLRWIDVEEPGANIVRNLAATLWIFHT